MPGETAATILQAITTCVATKSQVDIEYAIQTDIGERAHEVRFTPIGNDEVMAVVSDVTERRAADATRFQLAVRNSEERFRALVAESSDVIVILNEDARIMYASPAFTRLLGYPEDSLVGTLGFDIIHPDDVEAAANAFVAAHTGQNAASGSEAIIVTDNMRALLYEAADEASWSNPGRVILFIDLDHFKEVNDTYGHAAGDAILAGVADRLRENLRATDIAARIGGDEFMVLLGPTLLDTPATDLATRIVDALAVPFTFEGTQVSIGASVGVPTSGAEITPKELLSAADRAAYSAKHAGRGRVVEARG